MKLRLLLATTLAAVSALPSAAQNAASYGFTPAEMDTSVPVCQDFYRYAVGGWLKKSPVPGEFPRWGAFNELAERNREALHTILERLSKEREKAAAGSEERKLGDFYASCMDETAIEAQGAAPLQPELDRIAKIASVPDLTAEIARLQSSGVNALFRFGSQQDRKNSEEVIAGASQGGLALPDRDYYLKTDDKSKELREKYRAHVAKMLELLGDTKEQAKAEADSVLALETRLAEASMTRVDRRDPDKTYHRMSAAELAKLTPSFSWKMYLEGFGVPETTAVNVGQPAFFEAAGKELAGTSLADWKTYLRWHTLHAAAPTLSKRFVDEDFDFFSATLTGTKQQRPRWKRCVQATDEELGFALGKIYVKEYFPPESKARMDRLVKNMIAALHDDIQSLPWMGEATKKAALAKLAAFTPKIGYPDKWRDYSTLQVAKGPYLANVLAADVFEWKRDLAKIGKPVDRTEWGMTPPTVNAYYNASRNEIVFPAGILQPPFFDAKADDALNYGGIGAVIGHEMTHGFDDQGRKFDAKGNLTNWWTPEDLKNYEARSSCVEKQFAGYEVQQGLNVNGKLVLGESTADLGGLTIAYAALQKALEGKPKTKLDGFTPEQRFFLGWARVWAENDTTEYERLHTATNPHPLGRHRAIGAPTNLPEFAKAFGCKAGDPMVRAEACRIW